MERSLYSLIYAVFLVCVIVCAQAQDGDLSVKFEDDSTRYVAVGATDLQFKCSINRYIMFVLENTVEIVRITPSGDEYILTRLGKLVDAEPAYYELAVIPVNNDMIEIVFKITEVRDIDDATLLCRVTEENRDVITEAKVEVVVLRPLSSLSLQFADFPSLSESTDAPLQVDAGKYAVRCIADGSNPPVEEIHLTRSGEMVSQGAPVEEVMDEDVRTFRVSITGQVDLTVQNSGDVFECSARSKLGDTLFTSLPIKINVYEHEIMSNDSEAFEGNHEGLDIVGFGYQLDEDDGPNYERIDAGDENDDYVGVKAEPISGSKTKVILDLYKAKGWHFDKNFYIIVEHADGHTSREQVNLHQTEVIESTVSSVDPSGAPSDGPEEGPGDSSSMTKASLALLLLSVVCALLWF